MYLHVRLQVITANEFGMTLGALEWFLPGMNE